MKRIHLLDRLIGDEWPDLSSAEKVSAFEEVSLVQRLTAAGTYEAIQAAALHDQVAVALHFLPNADPEESPISVSFRQFFGKVTQTSNMFTRLGIGPTDVVSFLLPLLPETFYTFFGAEAAGVVNPINPMLEPTQIAEILRAVCAKVLVMQGETRDSDIWNKVQRIRHELPDLRAIVVVGGVTDEARGIYDFDELIQRESAEGLTSPRRIRAADTAAYFHTGGTTGVPKLVGHTHSNQVYHAWSTILMFRIQPGDSVLMGLPLFHVGGALTQTFSTLAGGGTVVVPSSSGWRHPNAVKNVWRMVERYRVTELVCVPTVLASAFNTPIDGADVSSIRCCRGGGSGIPVAVAEASKTLLNAPMLEHYGMTETTSAHNYSYMDRELRPGSVGHPAPYSRTRVVKIDADERLQGDCAPGEIGVVAMSGPGVFTGYFNEAHNKNAFVEQGWVNSGDQGRLDEEGYLWLTGRAKDVIIRGGHNIEPKPIEDILYQHAAVAQAALVGKPDAYAGELPVAYVELKPGAAVDENLLVAFVRERTPERAAVPVNIFFVDKIPLTGFGKVFKPALRWDAARRVAITLLADVPAIEETSVSVDVGPHPVHGEVITLTAKGLSEAERTRFACDVIERLSRLTVPHEIIWI